MRKLTRLEANKEVRRILNQHGVDLTYCQYSVSGMNINLSGTLCKGDGSHFNGSMVESMIQDTMRVLPGFTIMGAFDNWSFSSDHISFLGDNNPGKKSGGSENQVVYIISGSDYEDVG